MFGRGYYMPYNSLGYTAPALTKGLGVGKIFRGINFSSILNGASKTLNVVNQAVPLVKQAGPMVSNMKSMLRLASVFKDETDTPKKKENNLENNNINTNNYNPNIVNNDYYNYDNSPNFFI